MIQVPVRFLREEIVCELIVVFKNGLHEFIKEIIHLITTFLLFLFFSDEQKQHMCMFAQRTKMCSDVFKNKNHCTRNGGLFASLTCL